MRFLPLSPVYLSHRLVFLFLFSLTLVVYAQILKADFVLDSYYVVVDNPTIKQSQLYHRIWTQDFFAAYNRPEDFKMSYYRPIVSLTYIGDYRLWGLNPAGYRLVNIFIHSLNAFLFYSLLLRLRQKQTMAFLAAILFCLFPVHLWVVNHISARTHLLQVFFCLGSLLLLLRYFDRKNIWSFVASLVCFLFSILSRELAVIQPLIFFLVLYDYEKDYRKAIRGTLPFVIFVLFYLAFRMRFLPVLNGPSILPQGLSPRFLFDGFSAVVEYFLYFFLPQTSWTFRFTNFTSNSFGLVGAVLLLAGMLYGVNKIRNDRPDHFLWVGVGWLATGLMLFPLLLPQLLYLGPVLSQVHLYPPSMGFAVLLSFVLLNMIERFGAFGKILLIAVVFYYSSNVVYENYFWRKEEPLFRHVLQTERGRGHLVEDQLILKYERDQKVIREKIAGSHLPAEKSNWLLILGRAQLQEGQFNQAIKTFLEANRSFPSAIADRGIGYAYFYLKQYDLALRYLNLSYEVDPESHFTLSRLGEIFFVKKKYLLAEEYFQKSIFFNPDDEESLSYLATIYLLQDKLPLSQKFLGQAIKISKDKSYPSRFMAVELYALGHLEPAVVLLKKNVDQYRWDVESRLLLGKICFNLDYKEEAVRLWTEVLAMSPHHPEAKECLRKIPGYFP